MTSTGHPLTPYDEAVFSRVRVRYSVQETESEAEWLTAEGLNDLSFVMD